MGYCFGVHEDEPHLQTGQIKNEVESWILSGGGNQISRMTEAPMKLKVIFRFQLENLIPDEVREVHQLIYVNRNPKIVNLGVMFFRHDSNLLGQTKGLELFYFGDRV
jgi:hypothetical protein